MKKYPKVTVTESALDELLEVFDEALEIVADIRYSMWDKIKEGDKVGTLLHGVDLKPQVLDKHLIDGDRIIKRIKRQIKSQRQA